MKTTNIIGTKGIFHLFFILVCVSLTGCIVTYDTRTTQVEVMKPAIFNIPENIKTVALINSVSNSRDYKPFKYTNLTVYPSDSSNYHDFKGTEKDDTIKYRDLSNTCIDALEWGKNKDGYFSKVINYHDSLTSISPLNKELFDPERLFQKTKSDLCIFLDHFSFEIIQLNHFRAASNIATLSWTIVYNKDTLCYTYKQKDTLFFAAKDFPSSLTDNMKIKMLVNNSARYFGQSFYSKIIPTWIPVERIYYTSYSRNMLQAEKFARNQNWLKAAEIWNKQTKSKNVDIAAKASYNMALASEMEGHPGVAIEWLLSSYSMLKNKDEVHKANYQQYINILTQRKKEFEKLSQQVRN